MTVLTRDILVEGLRRDVVFEWLANFSVHADFLKAAFPILEVLSQDTLSLPFSGGWKSRVLTYRFLEADDKFAGRRIQIETDGKRLKGHLHFSLTNNETIYRHASDFTYGLRSRFHAWKGARTRHQQQSGKCIRPKFECTENKL